MIVMLMKMKFMIMMFNSEVFIKYHITMRRDKIYDNDADVNSDH